MAGSWNAGALGERGLFVARSTQLSGADLRQRLRQLVDQLPEEELQAAHRYLQYLLRVTDPVFRALLDAPEDEEPETPEEASAVQEARDDAQHGRLIPHEEVRRQLLRG